MNSIVRSALLDLGTGRREPDNPDEWVFTPRPKQADQFFPKAVQRAQAAFRKAGKDASRLDGYTWHGNRHTFASRLVMAGVDLRTVQQLGGWKTLVMVQRYGPLAPDHLQAAVERLVPGRGLGACQAAAEGTEISRKYDHAHVAAPNGSESASTSAQEVLEK